MSAPARVATTCTDTACTTLLVRGDRIGFVSVEQARKYGCNTNECRAADKNGMVPPESDMPSDIKLPDDFVLVHDTTGTLFCACDFFVVRWRGGGRRMRMNPQDERIAREYFGPKAKIGSGQVDVPRGKWKRVCRIWFVRYRRYPVEQSNGRISESFEHQFKYDPPVWLYGTERPLAYRMSLPEGCRVDDHGFVYP